MRYLLLAVLLFPSLTVTAHNGPYCEETTTIYRLDEITPLGFSAAALLDLTSPSDLKIEYGYKVSETAGRISVTPHLPTARYIVSNAVYPPCDDEEGCPEIFIICSNRVEVDVTLSLSSDDGAFSEERPATLTSFAADALLDQGTYAYVTMDIPSLDLVGNFFDDGSIEIPVWTFSGLFTAAGFTAEIYSWVAECFNSDDCAWCSYARFPGALFSHS